MSARPRTLRDLRNAGYAPRTVKEEIRANVLTALRQNERLFPGIVGYDDSVIPAVLNALLAQHDISLLGLRGHAKTRILRALTAFLDPEIPAIAGAPLHDDPLLPVSTEGRRLAAECGDDLPITWVPRDARYQEKLATPDVTMADLIGDLDPVKAAALGRSLVDEEAIAYGIIPRTNRGIFAINELPDLAPRIQVALLNIMEERDVQIRGFPMRLPLDLLLVFSANPEDYTKRGNLITPLRDRIAAQIHTHYPRSIDDAVRITTQEAWTDRGQSRVIIPEIAREVVEQVAIEARSSDWVDQSSGVSARLTIALIEAVVSNAERRAIQHREARAVVRVSDFFRATPAIVGKVELVFEGEREGPDKVATHLIGKAVEHVFDRRFPDFFAEKDGASVYYPITHFFKKGGSVVCDDRASDEAALARFAPVDGLAALVAKFLGAVEPEAGVFARELILEGLHQHAVLAKEISPDGMAFTDMVSRMMEDFGGPKGKRRGRDK